MFIVAVKKELLSHDSWSSLFTVPVRSNHAVCIVREKNSFSIYLCQCQGEEIPNKKVKGLLRILHAYLRFNLCPILFLLLTVLTRLTGITYAKVRRGFTSPLCDGNQNNRQGTKKEMQLNCTWMAQGLETTFTHFSQVSECISVTDYFGQNVFSKTFSVYEG